MGKKLIALLGIALSAQAVHANTYLYTSALNGFQEVSATPSQGVGVIQLTLDDSALTASGTGVVFFIAGPPTGFDIHNAPFGSNGPQILNIGPGGISGVNINFTQTLPDLTTFNSLKSILDARNGYFNIDTAAFPGGEIRGQIAPVPEPIAIASLGVGLVALVGRRRRKRMI